MKLQIPNDASKDCLYRLYLFATIAGVLVALGGIYAIWKQTEATARSAKAAEDNIKLQEAAQRQWVNLEKWQAQPVNTSRILLGIFFDIVNPTKVPLTLHYVTTKTADGNTNRSILERLLTPGNPYVHGATYEITENQMELFEQNKLVLRIECVVLFADAFGKHWEQTFVRLLRGGGGGLGITPSDTRNILRESNHKTPQPLPPEETDGH